MKISSHGGSHRGCVRENNEDAFLILPSGKLLAVADGLGGLPDGEEASRLAIEVISREAGSLSEDDAPDLAALFGAANREVHRVGSTRHADSGIGTTLTAALIHGERLYIAHVGDSAAYLWRSGELHLLTEEHTVAALYGGSHTNHGSRSLPEHYFHTLTRCIGAAEELEVFTSNFALMAGDRLLLCTDGLTKIMNERLITETLGSTLSARQAVEVFLEMALERGAPDNVALVAAFVQETDG